MAGGNRRNRRNIHLNTKRAFLRFWNALFRSGKEVQVRSWNLLVMVSYKPFKC